ncbi:SHOCT domain-containing protein [Aliiruegeria sabulilitoris]|uniref:SHOCT domain-containing protein n=1 Tax=Aliiruegeria sabulilitoris TaxID=1510458 RepID=UPI0008361338|nr:SHOCT domain-containing protein [Aliiruegeria sabulilitoris]NDR59743.1 SHOCT domain-containing protein [Pseudoruegeria sp. M32A2M]
MSHLSPEGQAVVNDVSARHGFSPDAVTHVLIALDQGGGSQAQFNHFELGGMGQWSMGGMTMIGDMFNNGLKARVDGLCSELSNALMGTALFKPPAPQPMSFQGQSQGGGGMQMQSSGGMGQSSLFIPGSGSSNWWPQELGQPGSTGAQNDLRYAYFPMISRLAIQQNGQATVYDTGPHQIGGFGQQQSGDQSLTFTSQFGLVRVADLPIVQFGNAQEPEPAPMQADLPASSQEPAQPVANAPTIDSNAIFDSLEKLGQLRDRGILTDAEFDQKKAELLSRL